MNRNELEDLARQWISLWSPPVDWELFGRLHADDFEDCSPAGRGKSKDDFAGGLRELVTAFPDLQTAADDLVIDEARQRAAVRRTANGTNRRKYLDRGPTHQKIAIRGIEIIEIKDGRIRRRWGEWDISEHLPSE